MNIFDYNRIMIVGNNGSGKSFLAKELSRITGLPLVHLDMEFWRPGWEQPSKEEWIGKQKELVAREKWIIEGNHTGTMELRYRAADLILFLDINRLVCLAGVVGRNGKNRSDMPSYLEEKFDREFLRLCKGLWSFSTKRKPVILGLHEKYPDKPFCIIESRKVMGQLLQAWQKEKAGP